MIERIIKIMLDHLPNGWKRLIQLQRVRRHYIDEQCIIETPDISISAILKEHVKIPIGCIIHDSVTIGTRTYMGRYCEICNAEIGN